VPSYSYADPIVAAFIVIPVALVVLLLWATGAAYRGRGATMVVARVAIGAALWMTGTWAVASSGVFRHWDATPPPFFFLVLGITVLSGVLAWSPFGRTLATAIPLWLLILVQAFRFPLELAMHAMYERGIMPVEMSYSGRNVDIITGVTALVVAMIVRTGRGRAIAAAWNVMGLLLVLNVVTVAILATPRFRYFGDDHLNVWITYPPFVWLPAVMVLAATSGHLLIFRALRAAA
jgi:hypothetical protein